MNANEIVLKFTLDIKGIKSAINQVEKDLKQFGSESVGATQGLNNALEQTEQQLTNISAKGRNFTNNATQSLDKFRVSAGAAGGSAIAFNRIIQDAPFGIIGVANNIQQFAEQLTALRGVAGGTGAALRTFFSSLVSPANLVILAVSAITSAFTAYQLSAQKSKDSTKELSDELGDYVKTLNGVDKATLDSTISIDQEIVKFDSLVSVLNDANSSYRQKKNAVDEIQSGYGQYLGNITNEEILVKGLGKAYDNVISALIAKSALEANATEINKNLKETAELNKKRNDEESRYIELQKLLQSKRSQLARTQELINSGEIKGSKTKNQLIDDIATIIQIQNAYNVSIDAGKLAIDKNDAALKNLIESYTNNLKALLSYDKGQQDAAESGDKLNRVIDEQVLIIERFGTASEDAKKKLENLAGVNLDLLAKEQKTLFELIATLKAKGPVNIIDAIAIELASKRLSELDKIIGSIASKRTATEITVDEGKLDGLEKILTFKGKVQALEEEISSLQARIKVTVDPEALKRYQEELKIAQDSLSNLLEKRKSQVEELSEAFVGLGSVIGKAFNNPQLGTFLGEFLRFAAKLVAANFKIAGSNAIAGASQASVATGAAAPITLPAFIAGALGVVAAAFAAFGNFGSSGGSSASSGVGSTFTNREFGGPVSKGRAYIVGERRPELFVPNTNGIIVPQLPSMDYSGASMSASNYGVDIRLKGPDDLLFFVEQAQIRRGLR